jgi:thioredoxin reductase
MRNESNNIFDVIIVGGNYAVLSAAMSLGRARRNVLVIDSGNPCNAQAPHSHNFITHDGDVPSDIAMRAKSQVEKYDTVRFVNEFATSGSKKDNVFVITLKSGENFQSRKLLFATGLKDIMPDIPGFSQCWGISILHCPYCHGYEVKDEKIGVLGNGAIGFDLARLIQQWSKKLTLFTNETATLSLDERIKLEENGVTTIKKKIGYFEHDNGHLKNIVFKDGSRETVTAIFAKIPFEQKSDLPRILGCEITEHNFIKIDEMQRTTISGIYAAGDNSYGMRAISVATAAGTKAGAVINGQLIEEDF